MKIDENTAIKCDNIKEVRDCFNKLEELGFAFKDDYSFEDSFLVFYNTYEKAFLNNVHFYISKDHNYINYKYFLKLYNKQIKEKEPKKKQPDLVVDKNGKILKVNNNKKMYTIYFFDPFGEYIHNTDRIGEALQDGINYANYYISEEACEKALKRQEIHRKLEDLAFELNGNKEIDWDDDKFKFYLDYCYDDKTIVQDSWKTIKHQGTIYCYSYEFKHKAIELIGKEDLKDYLINC